VTLVAGPVDDEAVELVIETVEGATAGAKPFTAHDLQWFFAEMQGSARVSAVTARGAGGEIVDEYTLSPMPPD
jgi:hypothetical protein